ncbi:MAG: hypothetical protein P1V97_29580, partial [Planctomycetota bacterium]|nr:hypothetical protein [Planctomycetota bacterium]
LLITGVIMLVALGMFVGGVSYLFMRFSGRSLPSIKRSLAAGGTDVEGQVHFLAQELQEILESGGDVDSFKAKLAELDETAVLDKNPTILSMYISFSSAGTSSRVLWKREPLVPMRKKVPVGETQKIGEPAISVQGFTFISPEGYKVEGMRYTIKVRNEKRKASFNVAVYARKEEP